MFVCLRSKSAQAIRGAVFSKNGPLCTSIPNGIAAIQQRVVAKTAVTVDTLPTAWFMKTREKIAVFF